MPSQSKSNSDTPNHNDQWSLLPEVSAVLQFFSEVAQQEEERGKKGWTWWDRPDNAPPTKYATLPNTMGLWARRDVGKSAILQCAVKLWNTNGRDQANFPGRTLRYPAWPFRADAIRDPQANVPVAVLGWLRESLTDQTMGGDIDSEALKKHLTKAANTLLKSDIASEYAAIGEALDAHERELVLREARESTYVWGMAVRAHLKNFFQELRGGSSNVVLLPFDDLDISPMVGYQLLETIRLLFSDHAGIAVVLCGDYNTLDAAIRAHLVEKARLEPGLSLLFAEQYIRKVVSRPVWVPRWKRKMTDAITERTEDVLPVDNDVWTRIESLRKNKFGKEYETHMRELAINAKKILPESIPDVVHLHNAPRVAVLMNWLWENFGLTWIQRAKRRDARLGKEQRTVLGLMMCRLVSGQITGCDTIQSIIDYPYLIAELGRYLKRWKERDSDNAKRHRQRKSTEEEDPIWIPCEEGAWVIQLADLMKNGTWEQIQALVRWDPSLKQGRGGWRAKRRLNDWVCETLYEASKIGNPSADKARAK